MRQNITLEEFLRLLSDCDGGAALETLSAFQSGRLTVEWLGVEDFIKSVDDNAY